MPASCNPGPWRGPSRAVLSSQAGGEVEEYTGLQEGQVTRTVRPLRPEGQAVAWRPGQDVVLSGREASSLLLPFPRNLVWKNAEGWHLREAVPRAWAGRAQLGPAS